MSDHLDKTLQVQLYFDPTHPVTRRRRPRQYEGGDYYYTVRAWMQRLGTVALDQRANQLMLNRQEIAVLVQTHRPHTTVVFKKLNRNLGLGGRKQIVFDRISTDGGKLSLGTVLHEIAHSLVLERYREQWLLRRQRMELHKQRYGFTVFRPLPKPPRAHGEEFCRTYARLLREHVSQQEGVA